MQLTTLTFSLTGISSRLTDPASQAILIDITAAQGNALVELIRLHIFREDNVVFELANKHLSKEDFIEIGKKMKKYFLVEIIIYQKGKVWHPEK